MIQKKYDDLDIFNNSSVVYMKKTNNRIISYVVILIIFSVLFLSLAFFYKFEIFNIYYGKVYEQDDETYVVLNVDSDFINISKRNYLEINNKSIKCHLNSFSDNYVVYNNKKYWEVTYECELPDELNVNNNMIEIKIDRRTTTLFNEFIKKVKRGIKNGRTKS